MLQFNFPLPRVPLFIYWRLGVLGGVPPSYTFTGRASIGAMIGAMLSLPELLPTRLARLRDVPHRPSGPFSHVHSTRYRFALLNESKTFSISEIIAFLRSFPLEKTLRPPKRLASPGCSTGRQARSIKPPNQEWTRQSLTYRC